MHVSYRTCRGVNRAFLGRQGGNSTSVDIARAAQLQVLLEGVLLPAEKAELLEYAVRQRAEPQFIAALRALPERSFESLDEVGEELVRVQPPAGRDGAPAPREESGDPPGGGAYTDPDPDTGQVRDLDKL
jgi:hypothetical protein